MASPKIIRVRITVERTGEGKLFTVWLRNVWGTDIELATGHTKKLALSRAKRKLEALVRKVDRLMSKWSDVMPIASKEA